MKLDFQAKHHENREGLKVHIAEDAKQFEGMGRTLLRMEGKIDNLHQTVQDIS